MNDWEMWEEESGWRAKDDWLTEDEAAREFYQRMLEKYRRELERYRRGGDS